MTGIRDEDIITASFVNAVHIVPFYVVKVERNGQKEVIIAIRGTLSIKVSAFAITIVIGGGGGGGHYISACTPPATGVKILTQQISCLTP